jgi:hypothetical protein
MMSPDHRLTNGHRELRAPAPTVIVRGTGASRELRPEDFGYTLADPNRPESGWKRVEE